MAIALRSSTTGASADARTNTVLTAPSGILDLDILLAGLVTSHLTTTPTPTPPAGFTRIGTELSYSSGGYQTKLGLWWKRASSESGSYTFSHSSADCQGWIGAYSGCLVSGTPVGTPSQNSGTGTTTTGTGIVTGAPNSVIFYAATDFNWGAGLAPPTGMTERLDGDWYLAEQLIASAGATGNRTQTNSNGAGDPWLAYMVELLAATSPATLPSQLPLLGVGS